MNAWSLTPTIQWIEILWTIVALPGLIRWFSNRQKARTYVRALRAVGGGNGRMIFARYTVRETTAFVVIESVFVLIGALAMTSATNPSAYPYTSSIIAAGLVGASIYITILGRDWAVVDRLVLQAAHEVEEATPDGRTE